MMDWKLGTAARTGWQEVRGEPADGQKAFAHVLANSVKDGRWGPDLGCVCLFRNRFSAWGPVSINNKQMVADFRASCALADDDAFLVSMASMIQAAMAGEPDPTGGATHYYNPKVVTVPPTWVTGDKANGIPPAIFCGKFGNQLFYRGVK